VSRLILRVDAAAGARGNSPAYKRAQTVRALISVHLVDARRGTKGNKKTLHPRTFFKPLSRGLSEATCSAGGASRHPAHRQAGKAVRQGPDVFSDESKGRLLRFLPDGEAASPRAHEFEHGFESRCETVLTMERQS
jgi:hypothetical protein